MKKAIGFLGGQYGDAITTIAAQNIFAENYPDFDFTFALSKKYEAIMPLFLNQKQIKNIHLWDGYDSYWPTNNDINYIKENNFDIVFNPMQGVIPNWFETMHQVSLCCARYKLPLPKTDEVTLNRYFEPNNNFKNYIAISPFANNGHGLKALSLERINVITNFLYKKGYKIVHLGSERENTIDNTINPKFNLFESVKILCACKLLITTDTAMSWIASAYKIPTLGLYAYGYHQTNTSKNWQPIQPNAKYLESYSVNDINMDIILKNIEGIL